MKSILLFLLCFISVFSSFGDTLAQFITKDSTYDVSKKEQANQAASVEKLTVGNFKAGTLTGNLGFLFNSTIFDDSLTQLGEITQNPTLTASFDLNRMAQSGTDRTFTIGSFSMMAGSGSMIKVNSVSFVYTQFAKPLTSSRSGVLPNLLPSLAIEFTLMAKINGGEYISLQTLSAEAGTQGTPWILGKDLKFDLSSGDIQSKIGSATSIEFKIDGKFGNNDGNASVTHLAFDNIKVDGSVVPYSPSVPEPSSALLCMMGVFPLLRRKRNS